jgi:capsular polysaccharide transport system permease protein
MSKADRLQRNPQAARGTIRRGFAVQARVIHAVVLREIQSRFGRGNLGFLWMFIEPLLLSFGIAFFRSVVSQGGAVPAFLYAVTGYAPYFAFRAMVGQSAGAFRANMTLLYHQQVKLDDVMIARTLLEAATVFMVIAIVAGGAVMVAGMTPNSVPTLVAGMALMFLYAHGLALLVATAAALSETFERLVTPILYLSLPFSGALFDLHSLPPSYRALMLWNPQVHFHEMVRDGMFGDLLPAYYSLDFMILVIIVVNLLGMLAMRAARTRIRY